MSNTISRSTLSEEYDFYITDKHGKNYHFKISTFIVPTGLLSEAIEAADSSPEITPRVFQILSDDETDIEFAELKLKEKIKKGINQQHLKVEEGKLSITEEQILRGRIEWTDSPNTAFDTAFEVDGRLITVEELLSLLEPYSGFNFKLNIVDPTDELD